MKRILPVFFLFIILAFSSCKKEESDDCVSNAGYAIATDDYTGCYAYLEHNDTIPSPFNNIESKSVDIDEDGELDYKLARSFSHSATGSSWTSFVIYSLNSNTEFIVDTTNEFVVEHNGDMINANYYWKNTSSYISTSTNLTVPPYSNTYTTNWTEPIGYIGIRINKNGTYKYGWIKLNNHIIISSLIEK